MQTKLDKAFKIIVDISNRKVTIPQAISWYVTDENIAHLNCQIIDEVEDSIIDIQSYKLSMRVLTPGKILKEVNYTLSDATNNIFTITLPDELITEKGRHQCELSIEYLGDKLTSEPFHYNIIQSIANQLDSTISKDSHYPLVLELEDKLKEWNNILDEQVSKVIILNNDVTNAEKTRQANEVQRIQAENTRSEFYDSFNSKLTELALNVKSFGAKGDGKTDDTEAIQAAFDYMNSCLSAVDSSTNVSFHTVFFPKGIYNISRPINIYNRARIVGERSIIRSSAEWCIDHPQGYYGGTIGWQTEISHMIFLGKNGVRLNTRQGDATNKVNLDYGHIYFHDCIFNNAQGYAFVGDVQSCLLKFDMCLIKAPMDVLCDDFVMDTCWCNWTEGYNVQEFIMFKGSKMYIDKCMFIPYSGNADASKEHAWVGIYDYTVPSGHQGMSFAVIDRCNFGAEASGHNIVNCKTSTRTNNSSQTSGVRILNSALALTQYAVRCFELPDTINIEGCRGVGGLNLVGLCNNFDKTKLDTLWTNLEDHINRMNINWRCENNSLRLIEASNKIRSYFCNDLLPIVSIRNFQRNYMNGAKLRLIPNTYQDRPYLVEKYIRHVDDAGQLWIRIPACVFAKRHYNHAVTENYRHAMHRFKISIIAKNSLSGTFESYSKNIWDYTFIICMAEQATNQSIRIIEDNVFKSNYQDSTRGQIIDSRVIINGVEHPTNLIPGDGYGKLEAIELALSNITEDESMQVIIHDMDLYNYEEI